MRIASIYCLDCPCGRHIETREEKLKCPECGRLLVIEWRENRSELPKPQPIPIRRTA
jgi:predicted RNA-binding Zn-ribbon protein involved in translation (DUF1610 family)